ncbi:FAD-dependent oxidoreductase [Rhodobacteraceae bacterium KMM 6894]|nr:FAD-dependent oxidoreductase [Rhodobacteraceae bacterium KMM 6894]
MSDAGIVIVDAGAAGIGAGLECQARGVSYLIVEASNRVGGRAHTATAGLERAWDLGCHWMHAASQNPLVRYADHLGARYAKTPGWDNSAL